MRLLKLIGKILLLPVVLLLGILRLLVKIGMEVSSFILGALMLIIFGCIIFTMEFHVDPDRYGGFSCTDYRRDWCDSRGFGYCQ